MRNYYVLASCCIFISACTQAPLKSSPVVVKNPPVLPTKLPEKSVSIPYETLPRAENVAPTPIVENSKLDLPKEEPKAVIWASSSIPAVESLIANAQQSSKAGDLDSASVALERALRIAPRDADLTYRLAELRLKQSQPRLAEDLAKKAAFLAEKDTALKKRCWLLIAQARELQQNVSGAREAQIKAESF